MEPKPKVESRLERHNIQVHRPMHYTSCMGRSVVRLELWTSFVEMILDPAKKLAMTAMALVIFWGYLIPKGWETVWVEE